MKKLVNHFYIAIITLIILFILLFVPKTIYRESDISQIYLGYPYAYIVQKPAQAIIAPYEYRILIPTENETRVDWKNFVISFLIVFLSIEIIMFSTKRIQY